MELHRRAHSRALLLLMGLCPTAAAAGTAWSGLGLALVTLAIFAVSDFLLFCLRETLPERGRWQVSLVLSGALSVAAGLALEAYAPGLYDAIGPYLPLSAVNCTLVELARGWTGIRPSLSEKTKLGIAFAAVLTVLGLLREFLGSGSLFGSRILPDDMEALAFFTKAPGALLTLALVVLCANALNWTPSSLRSDGEDGKGGAV